MMKPPTSDDGNGGFDTGPELNAAPEPQAEAMADELEETREEVAQAREEIVELREELRELRETVDEVAEPQAAPPEPDDDESGFGLGPAS